METDIKILKTEHKVRVLRFIGKDKVCIFLDGRPEIAMIDGCPKNYYDWGSVGNISIDAGSNCFATVTLEKIELPNQPSVLSRYSIKLNEVRSEEDVKKILKSIADSYRIDTEYGSITADQKTIDYFLIKDVLENMERINGEIHLYAYRLVAKDIHYTN